MYLKLFLPFVWTLALVTQANAAIADQAAAAKEKTPFHGSILAGFSYQYFAGIHIPSGVAELNLGGDINDQWDMMAHITTRYGRTLAGRPLLVAALGPTFSYRKGVFRFGAGIDIGYMETSRATTDSAFRGVYLAIHPDFWIHLGRPQRGRGFLLHMSFLAEGAPIISGFAAQTTLGYRF